MAARALEPQIGLPRTAAVRTTTGPRRRPSGRLTALTISQVLAGVGVASGVAVGGLLAERLSGTVALAGFAPTASVLGAALWALPLARLAGRRGRSWGLAVGYLLALAGTGLIFTAAATGLVPLLFVGTAAFGAADAAGLQARFAAAEMVGARYRARALSVVMWATTLGSIAGPNLSEFGGRLGRALGIEPLTGPYLFAAIAFGCAVVVLSVGLAGRSPIEADQALPCRPGTALLPALRAGFQNPRTRLAIVAVTCSHTIMVGVMVMTPLHLTHHGMTLDLVGLMISIHILGMYGASPILGWLADRLGGPAVIGIGVIIFAAALLLGGFGETDNGPVMSLMLGLLGLGWSAGVIGGSTLLAASVSDQNRVPLQGGTDALMNLAAAGSSALSGLVMGLADFPALNLVAAIVAVPMAVLVLRSLLTRQGASAVQP